MVNTIKLYINTQSMAVKTVETFTYVLTPALGFTTLGVLYDYGRGGSRIHKGGGGHKYIVVKIIIV